MVKGMISIVLPVYNAEKYLSDTIHSVLNQTYQNFEIIAVNDGSKDHSLEILKQIDDSRLRIIDKENTGVSDTRNVALEAVEGEYVCFLDADDCLAPQFLQRLQDVATEKQADMVVCNYMPFRGTPVFDDKRADMVSVQSTEILVRAGVLTSACTKLIRTSILRRYPIQFAKDMTFGEDLFFCWKAFLVSENVWFIDEKLYGYRMTGSGATSKFHPNLYEKYRAAFLELKSFGKMVGKEDDYAMDVFFTTRMPSFLMMITREKSSVLQKRKQLAQILSDVTIVKTLNDWERFTTNINRGQVSFYSKCKNKKVNALLRQGYLTQIRGWMSRMKSKVLG